MGIPGLVQQSGHYNRGLYIMENFFRKYLRTGQHWNKKVISMKDAKWQSMTEDEYLGQWMFPKGTIFKCFETTNFGWIVLHPDAVTAWGHKPAQRIFKF